MIAARPTRCPILLGTVCLTTLLVGHAAAEGGQSIDVGPVIMVEAKRK